MPSCTSHLFRSTLNATQSLHRFIVDSHDVGALAFPSLWFLTPPHPQEETLGASSFALHSLLSEKSLAGIPLLVVGASRVGLKDFTNAHQTHSSAIRMTYRDMLL